MIWKGKFVNYILKTHQEMCLNLLDKLRESTSNDIIRWSEGQKVGFAPMLVFTVTVDEKSSFRFDLLNISLVQLYGLFELQFNCYYICR